MGAKSKEIPSMAYACNGRTLDLGRPKVMAIVNLTPDSFYDGGKYDSSSDVLSDIEGKIADGAAIIDLGAASSRPGAPDIPEEEEWRRLGAVLPAVRKRFPATLISVDTWRASIAERSAAAGADIVNDISGGRRDPGMKRVIGRHGLIYIMMHMDGTPATMTQNQPYEDVTGSVLTFFREATATFKAEGCEQIILDPGFGFGKSLRNNYELLRGLTAIRSLGYPVLAGVSRKSMIGRVTGSNPVTSLNGTTVLHTIALLNGASILRVHDVAEARQAIQLVEYYRQA